MPIDHVIMAVRDFDAAAARLREEYGLASVVGGKHAGWGTGNRIVPLGSGYLELIGVLDETEARGHDVGRMLIQQLEEGDHLIGWCVTPPDFEGAVARLGLEVTAGSRVRPDGVTLAWRSAGFLDAMRGPSRPFFIDWQVPDADHPGQMQADHRVRPTGIAWIEVGGEPVAVAAWIGDEAIDVRVRPGPSRVLAVGIDAEEGTLLLT